MDNGMDKMDKSMNVEGKDAHPKRERSTQAARCLPRAGRSVPLRH